MSVRRGDGSDEAEAAFLQRAATGPVERDVARAELDLAFRDVVEALDKLVTVLRSKKLYPQERRTLERAEARLNSARRITGSR